MNQYENVISEVYTRALQQFGPNLTEGTLLNMWPHAETLTQECFHGS